MNLTHAYSKYIKNAYTNADNTGDNADVPRVTSPSSLLGSADRYKAPRVGSCKAIQDSIVTISITDAFRSFVTFCIERGGTPIYTLSLLNVTLSITKDTQRNLEEHIFTKGNTIIFKAILSSFGVLCKGEKREEKRGREKGRKEGDYRG
jgi:hypothetical protein